MKTVDCVIVVEVRRAVREDNPNAIASAPKVQMFPAKELRASTKEELDARAHSFALKTVRLSNKSRCFRYNDLELLRVVEIRDVNECEATCATCVHSLKSPKQMPCCRCDENYSMWK
jgi:hypothetical protein